MKHRHMFYRIVIEQDEDGQFVAECPAPPGCISQGGTRDQAVANIKDAIVGYLASLKKHGERFRRQSPRRSSRFPREPAAGVVGARRTEGIPSAGVRGRSLTGSHIILRHPNRRRLTVPDHRELAKGTLRLAVDHGCQGESHHHKHRAMQHEPGKRAIGGIPAWPSRFPRPSGCRARIAA